MQICSRNHVSDTNPFLSSGDDALAISQILPPISSLLLTDTCSMGGPSTRNPTRTTTSCNVTVSSPDGKWNVLVSGLHRSTNAVSRCQSSPIQPNNEQ